MHLENFFLVISQCLDQRNGKKPGEPDIFTFLLLWDSLLHSPMLIYFELLFEFKKSPFLKRNMIPKEQPNQLIFEEELANFVLTRAI